jgi:maltose-binding protein MalE
MSPRAVLRIGKQKGRNGMRKLLLLAALLAMVLLAALPAIAQVSQETEQEGESGELDQDFSATQEGSNSNQCVGIQGVGNTGNSQNVIDLIQYSGEADDFEFEEVGSDVTVSPTNTTDCTSEVNQAASASG